MNTDEAWKQWGEKDPYYGVLSDQKFRKNSLEDNREEFIESGRRHWDSVRATCTRLFGPIPNGCCLDFGCGVGRVLAPMARDFSTSVGIDVSPHMIAEARKNSPGSEFILSDDDLSHLKGNIDLVHSFIVLQHIPPHRGRRFIGILLDHLNPGGMAALHITLKRSTAFRKRAVYFLKHRVPGARLLFNLLQGKPLSEPMMQMNEYDLQDILRIFASAKMRDVHIQPHPASDTFGVMIFARKDAGT